jgi:AcrR family transcriptional regulator
MRSPKARPREYHHGDLRHALVEAALTTLETQGWHELSLRDVARQAGVSHAAPYRHFPSKEALLAALAEVGYSELADAMEEAVREWPGEPTEQLRGTGRAYVALALRRPALFRLMFSGAVCNFTAIESFSAASARSFRVLVRLITEAQAMGVMRAGPPQQAALAAWSLVHGLSLLLLEKQLDVLGGGALDPLAMVDGATLLLHLGLNAPEPPARTVSKTTRARR